MNSSRARLARHQGPVHDPPSPGTLWFACTVCLRERAGMMDSRIDNSYQWRRPVAYAPILRLKIVATANYGPRLLYYCMDVCPRCGSIYGIWLPPWLLLDAAGNQLIDWME